MDFVQGDNTLGGGSIPVWIGVERKLLAGGTMKEADIPSSLPVTIPCATPVYLNQATSEFDLLKVYELKDAYTSGDTELILEVPEDWTEIAEGDVVMVAPATLSTTGTGFALGAISTATEGQLTVTVADLGEDIAAGTLFVEATAAGASKEMSVKPNGLTFNDLRLKENTYHVTTPVVVSGELLVDRVQPIPDCVKAALPMITLNSEG